jgi:hypothetical protein
MILAMASTGKWLQQLGKSGFGVCRDVKLRPVGVPAAIVPLSECRERGWEDSALAYRSGRNDCRRAALGEEPLGYAGCHELATATG